MGVAMSYPKGLHPGATWLKSDFQCHSPRDPSWEGEPDLPGGSIALEAKRETWAKEFLAAATSNGLRTVAVTDHHDFGLAPYVMGAATGDTIVFPGVEVTCSDNAQCIALFDPSCDRKVVQKFIARLTGVAVSEPNAEKRMQFPLQS